jgi:hypothetical protein
VAVAGDGFAGISAAHGGAVMSPLNASIGGGAGELVKPNDRLTSTERLDIYHRQYWYRILDSFNEDFPGLCSILGERAFARLSRAYLTDCPSQSFTLRNLGSRLEAWLTEHPEFAGRHLAPALDMIRWNGRISKHSTMPSERRWGRRICWSWARLAHRLAAVYTPAGAALSGRRSAREGERGT